MDVPVPKTSVDAEAESIALRQARFSEALGALIAVYRDFDRKPRRELKPMMKDMYAKMVDLGESIGVSRLSLDNLWRG